MTMTMVARPPTLTPNQSDNVPCKSDPGPSGCTTVTQQSSSGQEKQFVPRLLYRGAFSLPDSNLLLDGVTFAINLPADDHQAGLKLLDTPLPLALESMRGRQSLQYIGVERMDDLCCDYSGGITVHIHPRCYLTYQLFTNNLCMEPITSPSGHTNLGIRIRLGDTDSYTSEPTDIVIYGRPHPSTSILQLCVARIIPLPPPVPKPIIRLRPAPRPDDPIPRRPPIGFGVGGMARIGLSMKRTISVVKKDDGDNDASGDKDDGPRKRVKRDEVEKKQPPVRRPGPGVFKVPALPAPKRDRPIIKPRERPKPDIEDPLPTAEREETCSELESANKVIVKKTVVRQMATIGISKSHPDFKDFFGHVYRGVSFALRVKLKTIQLDKDTVLLQRMERLVQSHVEMYIEEKDSGVEC